MYYKDMTFCGHYKECKFGEDCAKKLDKKVIKDAEKEELDISQFFGKPECFKRKQ